MIGVEHLMVAFWSGAAVALMATGLGGYMVFRTKREPYETMFRSPGESETYVSDPVLDEYGVIPEPEEPELPEATLKANERLMQELTKEIARTRAAAEPERWGEEDGETS